MVMSIQSENVDKVSVDKGDVIKLTNQKLTDQAENWYMYDFDEAEHDGDVEFHLGGAQRNSGGAREERLKFERSTGGTFEIREELGRNV